MLIGAGTFKWGNLEITISKQAAEAGFYFLVAIALNYILCFAVVKISKKLETSEAFRNWFKEGIEDADDELNFKDIIATASMFLGIVFFWLLMDIYLGSLIFSTEHLTTMFAVGTTGTSLLGAGGYIKTRGKDVLGKLGKIKVHSDIINETDEEK